MHIEVQYSSLSHLELEPCNFFKVLQYLILQITVIWKAYSMKIVFLLDSY